MKLDKLPLAEDGFKCHPIEFCGIVSYLIIPNIDASWTKHNLHLRSLIVRGSDFEILSSGFPKFFNAGEKPYAYPDAEKYDDWRSTSKIDGSLLIVDYVNDQFSMRTRGTTSYTSQANAKDFEQLLVQYPLVLNTLKNNQSLSLLFEIMTPNNIIVIPSADITFTFLGAVDKEHFSLLPFNEYQQMGWFMEVSMPEIHSFKTLSEMIENVKSWVGKEGVVLSFNNNQNRIKIKSDDYLIKHRLKSELNSENNFVEFYVQEGMPDYQEFFNIIEKVVDFEIATAFRGRISKVVGVGKEVNRIMTGMRNFVNDIRNFDSRKNQALAIIQTYGGNTINRSGMVFAMLDNKPLNKAQIIELFWQVMNS